MHRLTLFVLLFPVSVYAADRRPMQIEDLFRFKRVADPQISPDGKWVAYEQTTVDLAGNRSTTNLWLVAGEGITPPRQLTSSSRHDRHPRWSPDGSKILFESDRSGETQLWSINVHGGEARQLTTLSTEASTGIWSPDGRLVAFVSAVYPEFSEKPFSESDKLNKQKMEEARNNPVKAKVFTRLFFRHWDSYVEDKRQHLFVMPADGGEPKDVTPGNRDAYPTSTTFSIGDDFSFSPDGNFVLFTAVPARTEAWSTNHDICRVPVTGGTTEWENLTKDNLAADAAPRFSPDGKQLAYRRQQRTGFEADKWELVVVPCDSSGTFTEKPRSVTAEPSGKPDLSADEFIWVGSDKLLFVADNKGYRPIFEISTASTDHKVACLEMSWAAAALSASQDGHRIAFSASQMSQPAEVITHTGDLRGAAFIKVSHANDVLLAELELARPESVTVPGAGGTPMQMWILKPPGFDPAKKWPLAFLVHGGPQGAWENGWSYRWNPELWAAQGYVVALPNPRGSTGFGQKYVDEISGDWGGKCFEDLMAGVAFLEKQPYIDRQRMAAAGASFGGYMMDWFQGHTDKFKTLITHCGVYNFDSMYATTEELWFDEWEHGGPPWGLNRSSYEKHSPHRYAKNFKTPMLIIHNDRDYRVPVSEGLQLFTTLQRLGIESKMINFPDEGHWVLKPANSAYWHREVFAWLKKYVPPGAR